MGGSDCVRGILLQTIVCVLDLFNNDNDWTQVSLEPNVNAEKVDILWKYINGEKKAIQVKSKRTSITTPLARNWATQLQNNVIADSYELILIGPCVQKLTKNPYIGDVTLRIENIDIDNLFKNAVFSFGVYLERKGR